MTRPRRPRRPRGLPVADDHALMAWLAALGSAPVAAPKPAPVRGTTGRLF